MLTIPVLALGVSQDSEEISLQEIADVVAKTFSGQIDVKTDTYMTIRMHVLYHDNYSLVRLTFKGSEDFTELIDWYYDNRSESYLAVYSYKDQPFVVARPHPASSDFLFLTLW